MKVGEVMTPNVVSCHPQDGDDWAAQLLWENDCGVLPVVDSDGRPVGMVTDRDLCMAAFTRGRALNELVVADAMSREVFGCAVGDSLETALDVMRRWGVRRLPVLDADGHLVGMLALNDVVRALEVGGAGRAALAEATLGTLRTIGASRRPAGEPARASPRARALRTPPVPNASQARGRDGSTVRVRELMTTEVATVRPADTLGQAAERMRLHDCGCVVVVDEGALVVGVLTDRDVCLAALPADVPLSQLTVEGAMTRNVFTCAPDDPVAEAERRMGQHQIRRLPVVDGQGRLRGILSLDDLAREACREEGLLVPPVSTQGVGRTLGQVSRPHLVERD